jgi:predicted PurR-regulated permease PerM
MKKINSFLFIFCLAIIAALFLVVSAHLKESTGTTPATSTFRNPKNQQNSQNEGHVDSITEEDDEETEELTANSKPSLLRTLLSIIFSFVWEMLLKCVSLVVGLLMRFLLPNFSTLYAYFAYWIDILTDRKVRLYLTATATLYKLFALLAPMLNYWKKMPIIDSVENYMDLDSPENSVSDEGWTLADPDNPPYNA